MIRAARAAAVFLCLGLAAPLYAAAEAAEGGREAPAILHGGIGEDERLDMASQRADYNLRLTFAVRRSGHFVADVQVQIEDAAGRPLLRVSSEGPWLFARMPPGRLRVRAVYGSSEQVHVVRVPATGAAERVLYWDDPSARPEPDAEPEHPPRRRR